MILCEVEEKWCARCEVSLPASQGGTIDGELIERMKRVASAP